MADPVDIDLYDEELEPDFNQVSIFHTFELSLKCLLYIQEFVLQLFLFAWSKYDSCLNTAWICFVQNGILAGVLQRLYLDG